MTLSQKLGVWGERLPLPDFMSRAGIATLVGRTDRKLRQRDVQPDGAFVREMAAYPYDFLLAALSRLKGP